MRVRGDARRPWWTRQRRHPTSAGGAGQLEDQLREALRLLLAAAQADGERLRRLALAVDDDARHLLQLRVADLLADRLVAVVELHAEPGIAQAVDDRPRRLHVLVADREDTHLHR